jgi:hypothetical protein
MSKNTTLVKQIASGKRAVEKNEEVVNEKVRMKKSLLLF